MQGKSKNKRRSKKQGFPAWEEPAVGYCSPQRQGNKKQTGVCLTSEELRTIAALYNKKHPENPIPLPFPADAELVKELDARFGDTCKPKQDHCWIERGEIKEARDLYHKLSDNYRPPMPKEWMKNKRQWLNTFDIMNVMRQYKDPSFKFLGVFPVDFNQMQGNSCIVQDMCRFDAKELVAAGITQFGVVFNLDRHDQPGSHWVSCFCSLDPSNPKFGICYYDSGGIKPPETIHQFMVDVKKQVLAYYGDKLGNRKFKGKFNPKRQQFKNTECGIFCMVFIVLCLKKASKTNKQVRAMIPTHSNDNKIHRMRAVLYRPPANQTG